MQFLVSIFPQLVRLATCFAPNLLFLYSLFSSEHARRTTTEARILLRHDRPAGGPCPPLIFLRAHRERHLKLLILRKRSVGRRLRQRVRDSFRRTRLSELRFCDRSCHYNRFSMFLFLAKLRTPTCGIRRVVRVVVATDGEPIVSRV